MNHTGTSSVKGVTSWELWFQRKPEIKHLHVFVEEVYVHVPKEKRRALDTKAKKGYFVEHGDEIKGFRVWFPDNNKIETVRDVAQEELIGLLHLENVKMTRYDGELVEFEDAVGEVNPDNDQDQSPDRGYQLRDRTTLKAPTRYQLANVNNPFLATSQEPLSYQEAIRSEEAAK
ncbi:uncharacterized protein [Temnothorax nylanderi]|uniref:uncharacterized protein n=1 Tax=Temnothorax nylanderi TaxID=102681 RepID=UPI003A869B3F